MVRRGAIIRDMAHITVYAVKSLQWNGATYAPGAPVIMEGIDALVLKNKGHISLEPVAVSMAEAPDPPKKRGYTRRSAPSDAAPLLRKPWENAPTVADLADSSDEDA